MTDAKTALAGATLEVFSATLKALMAVFNAGIALSHPLGCWDLTSMVGIRGRREGCEEVPNPNRDKRPCFHDTLREDRPAWWMEYSWVIGSSPGTICLLPTGTSRPRRVNFEEMFDPLTGGAMPCLYLST